MAEPVPPGFRFHPTEEELLSYYLAKKVASEKFELDIIKEVDLNKLEPWDLQEKCRIGSTQQSDSYFFSHKDKKYPTGTRTNRATGAGFWKATGRDKAVSSNYTRIGMRKTLVFYRGRAPRGQKTDWIMHEYRLHVDGLIPSSTSTELEGWVVCHVFKKRNHRPKDEKVATATSVNNTPMNKPPLCKKEEEEEEREEEEEQEREEEEEQEEEEELEYKIEPQESYLHLPNLESPNCSGEDQGSKGNIEPFTIDLPEGSNSRPLFASYSSMHNHHEDLSLLTDWSLLESLTKEARFGPSFFTQIPSEIQPPTRFLPLEYVSACDLDLWSFPNTSIFM